VLLFRGGLFSLPFTPDVLKLLQAPFLSLLPLLFSTDACVIYDLIGLKRHQSLASILFSDETIRRRSFFPPIRSRLPLFDWSRAKAVV